MKSSLSAAEFSATFQAGNAFFSFPIKLIAVSQPSDGGVTAIKVAFAVPKRLVKRAVHRNRIKRQMRAAFQKNENVLRGTFLTLPQLYHLVFIYSDKKTDVPFTAIEKSICSNVKALANSNK